MILRWYTIDSNGQQICLASYGSAFPYRIYHSDNGFKVYKRKHKDWSEMGVFDSRDLARSFVEKKEKEEC